jgi:hypothetical protein
VCNLTAAQNAKRDFDECKGGAERAEEEVKNLKNEWRGFRAVPAGGGSRISGFSEHRTCLVTCRRMKGLTLVGEWLRLGRILSGSAWAVFPGPYSRIVDSLIWWFGEAVNIESENRSHESDT